MSGTCVISTKDKVLLSLTQKKRALIKGTMRPPPPLYHVAFPFSYNALLSTFKTAHPGKDSPKTQFWIKFDDAVGTITSVFCPQWSHVVPSLWVDKRLLQFIAHLWPHHSQYALHCKWAFTLCPVLRLCGFKAHLFPTLYIIWPL